MLGKAEREDLIKVLKEDISFYEKDREKIDTIILFGAHMHKQSEPFILTHGFVETPFGDIEVDKDLTEKICDGISLRRRSPRKFPDENTFELQFPFIKYFYPDSKIVVCGVAPSFFASFTEVDVIGGRIGGKRNKVVLNPYETSFIRIDLFSPR